MLLVYDHYKCFNSFSAGITCRRQNANECININICKCLVSNKTNNTNFQPPKVMGRSCDTQLQVGEDLNYLPFLTYHFSSSRRATQEAADCSMGKVTLSM